MVLAAAMVSWWPVRLGFSILSGLVFVRAFILYHDFMHGALLPGSKIAKGLLHSFGLFALTPPRHWRYSHNHHHAHVGKENLEKDAEFPLVMSDVGSFPLMTTDDWQTATRAQRLKYRISRHPLTILFGYVTIFLHSLCLNPLLRNPRRYWDGAVAVGLHGGILALVWIVGGFAAVLYSVVIPFAISAAMGGYLFYAQHSYDGLRIPEGETWTYYEGALESSSYMDVGPVMHWFTGNIGYHHVHHLNPHIPFYRLPEAMAKIPELQNPTVTSLHPREIWACFRANLWEPRTERMVSYREAAEICRSRIARQAPAEASQETTAA
jgi:omega-6 fatty acid desaturase (delta-12 desaturase)